MKRGVQEKGGSGTPPLDTPMLALEYEKANVLWYLEIGVIFPV